VPRRRACRAHAVDASRNSRGRPAESSALATGRVTHPTRRADAAIEALRRAGVPQVAGFHPAYRFEGPKPDDVGSPT